MRRRSQTAVEEVRSLLTSHRKAGSFLESPGLHVAGQTISHYRVLGHWASAGWAASTRRRTHSLERPVALKFLPEDTAREPLALERFRRASASALNHPNICTTYELGEHAGRGFIAMEFLDCITLRQRIEGVRWRWKRCCPWPSRLPTRWRRRTPKASSIATSSRRIS
jgi:serine/threonine protein kinase